MLVSSVGLFAQENDYMTDRLEFLSVPTGSILMGKSLPPPDTKGSYFLDDEWSEVGSLELYVGKVIEGVQLKYNLNSNLIYVKIKKTDENFFLEGNKVKNFVFGDESTGLSRKFVNVSELTDKEPTEGFYEIYFNGNPMSIVRVNYTYLKKANYMEGADMGRRDNEILKKMDYFFYNGEEMVEIKSNKNRNLEVFGEKRNEIKKYAKVNGLDLKEPVDLAKIIGYYNNSL
ncbi:hypothetical protein AB9P05_03620 [Roseivirga sp. BDSF3-8]|uniref:hypothetical protein n=1 Tax=Roseivirga sp. BDSF3-8 TaxID=3241598 RepID=UPI00353237DC